MSGNLDNSFAEDKDQINHKSVIECQHSDSITSCCSGNDDENWRNVLNLCQQINPIPFGLEFPSDAYKRLEPIDTGSYSLVSRGFDKKLNKDVVFKIINVVSSKITKKLRGVSFDGKERLSDVFNEIKVSKCLSQLHSTTVDYRGHEFMTHSFPRLLGTRLVQGSIPNYLILKQTDDSMDKLEMIEKNRETPGTPREYLVLTMKHCGHPLWKMVKQKRVTANQLLSVCYQLTLALTVSEIVYEFEHRDLHIANVLIKKTKKKNIKYVIKTETYSVQSFGIKAYIIDTTFSRIRLGDNVYFTSLSSRLNPLLKTKKPDLQEWVYMRMAAEAKDNWYKWNPKTNLLWLRYFYKTVQNTWMFTNEKNSKPKQDLQKLLNKIPEYNTLEEFIVNIDYKTD